MYRLLATSRNTNTMTAVESQTCCLTIQTASSISPIDFHRCCFPQACSSRDLHHNKRELNPQVLHPWKSLSKGVARVKRDWIIPPIRVLENSKQVPEDLVQVTWTNTHLSAKHFKLHPTFRRRLIYQLADSNGPMALFNPLFKFFGL